MTPRLEPAATGLPESFAAFAPARRAAARSGERNAAMSEAPNRRLVMADLAAFVALAAAIAVSLGIVLAATTLLLAGHAP